MLYLILMFISVVLMVQTGALGNLNATIIPALSEMWGVSKIEKWAFILIGHDDMAELVQDQLDYLDAPRIRAAEDMQWVCDLAEGCEASRPRNIGMTVAAFLKGSVVDNSDDQRVLYAPLQGKVEAPTAVRRRRRRAAMLVLVIGLQGAGQASSGKTGTRLLQQSALVKEGDKHLARSRLRYSVQGRVGEHARQEHVVGALRLLDPRDPATDGHGGHTHQLGQPVLRQA